MLCKFENGRCLYHHYRTETECRVIEDDRRLHEQVPTFLTVLHQCLTYLESPDQETIVGRDELLGRLREILHPRPTATVLCIVCGTSIEQSAAERVVGGYLCEQCK